MRIAALTTISKSLVLAASLAALTTGCAPTHEIEVLWTISGAEPTEDVCSPVVESVRVTAYSSSTRDGERTPSTASFDCTAGSGLVQTGSFADLLVELLRGETVVGGAQPFEIAPSSAILSEPESYSVDTDVSVGILTAELKVAGERCGDAGASSFAVTLVEVVNGLDTVLVDEANVSCDDGDATYVFDGVKVRGTYLLAATTTKDGASYATAGAGARIIIERAAMGAGVNLILADTTED